MSLSHSMRPGPFSLQERGQSQGQSNACILAGVEDVLAEENHADHAGDGNGANDRSNAFSVEGPADFFESEDHAGDGGVEGGGDTCGTAGEDHAARHEVRRQFHEPVAQVHEAGTDVDGWAFATDGDPKEQGHGQQQYFSGRDLQGEHHVPGFGIADLQGRDRLGNARAFGAWEPLALNDND